MDSVVIVWTSELRKTAAKLESAAHAAEDMMVASRAHLPTVEDIRLCMEVICELQARVEKLELEIAGLKT